MSVTWWTIVDDHIDNDEEDSANNDYGGDDDGDDDGDLREVKFWDCPLLITQDSPATPHLIHFPPITNLTNLFGNNLQKKLSPKVWWDTPGPNF